MKNTVAISKLLVIATLTGILLSPATILAAPSKSGSQDSDFLKKSLVVEEGTLVLQNIDNQNNSAAQLVLKRPGNITIIADTYEGLEPFELLKCDFNGDGTMEIVATLKYPDSQNVIPYVYSFTDSLEKVFPKEKQEADLLNCREVFISHQKSVNSLCLKYLVSYHDFGPPDLFKLEMYTMQKDNQFKLTQIGYNEGTHFNLLMNLAAEYIHKGRTLDAAALYDQALTSSTGDITRTAFTEALFSEAEALKFSGKYSEASKLFEKLVLEYTDSKFTELAQKELEFLFTNQKSPELLNKYFAIRMNILNNNNSTAMEQLDKLISNNPKCSFMDRLLFTKAELLVSDDHLEDAVSIYKQIKVNYPESNLIDSVDEMLEDLESKPVDADSL